MLISKYFNLLLSDITSPATAEQLGIHIFRNEVLSILAHSDGGPPPPTTIYNVFPQYKLFTSQLLRILLEWFIDHHKLVIGSSTIAFNTKTATWKLSNIIPIPKPKEDIKMDTSSRPISLHAGIVNNLEKIILPYITNNIQHTNTQHTNTQHDFKNTP